MQHTVEYIRVEEAAKLAEISRSLAYRLVAEGAWPSVRIGSLLRVPLPALRAWIAANTRGGVSGR